MLEIGKAKITRKASNIGTEVNKKKNKEDITHKS